MREMKDSGIEWIGEIPTDWEQHPVYYYFGERKKANISCVEKNLLSLSYGKIVRKDIYSVGGLLPSNFSTYNIIEKGDIVIRPTDLQNDKKSLRTGYVPEHGIITSAYITLNAIKDIDTKYFYYLLYAYDIARVFYNMGNGVRQGLNYDEFSKLPVLGPPKRKQEDIASFLDSKCAKIDALTADIQAEIDILEQYKKSIVYNAVRHGIRKSRNLSPVDSDVWNNLPDGWKLVDIKYLFEIVKRAAGKEGYNVLSVTQNGLKIKDITSGDGQLANNYSNYQFVYPTDYVMNHMDLLTGWVDLSSMFGVTSPDYRVFRLRNKEENDCSYFKYVMQCCYMNRIFYSLGQGVSNLGRWRLQTSTFNNFKVPVPPIEEQKEISTYLDAKISDVNSTIAEKHKQIEILTNYKKSLIYEYVTGKKEIPATNTNNVVAINPQAILLGGIVRRIGKSQHGRTQLQKLLYLCNAHFGMNQNIQYYRYEHGPYDIHLNDYIRELVKNQWFNEKTQDKKCVLVSGKRWEDFEQNYPDPFGEKTQEIGNLFKQLKDLSTRQIERIATLYAAWNDFLLDGITPSDDQIIQDVITNWTANKANFQYTTWQDSLNQMKQYGLIPKGTGLHTLPKP